MLKTFLLLYIVGSVVSAHSYDSEADMLRSVPTFLQASAPCLVAEDNLVGMSVAEDGTIRYYRFTDLEDILPLCEQAEGEGNEDLQLLGTQG